jgi:putative phage repressor|nr:MAG TPA: putative transcriptional regulator [Caudoviricetes sp.]
MILDRIKAYIDYKDITIAAFERSIGMSNASFGKSLKNKGAIGTDKLENILSVYNDLSPEWLLTGKGDMLKTVVDSSAAAYKASSALPKSSKNPKGIPLIPLNAVAGFPATDSEGVYLEDCDRYTIPEFEAKGANFLIRVSGDSMMPLYNSGDIIACRKIPNILFFQWGGVYVLDTSQGVLVKYVEEYEKDDECILCVSENKRFKPFPLPKSDIRSLSTIIGLVRLV